MTEGEMLSRSNCQMIQLKRSGTKTVAFKCVAVSSVVCPVCGKHHRHFWRLPDDAGFKPNDPANPGYTSRRFCEAKALRLT